MSDCNVSLHLIMNIPPFFLSSEMTFFVQEIETYHEFYPLPEWHEKFFDFFVLFLAFFF
jgi:hypothetical protein